VIPPWQWPPCLSLDLDAPEPKREGWAPFGKRPVTAFSTDRRDEKSPLLEYKSDIKELDCFKEMKDELKVKLYICIKIPKDIKLPYF
jgi:hypothetical protein